MPSASTIHQSAIYGGPSSAIVRNYSFGDIAEMEVDFRAALPPEPFAVGISIGLAPVGPSVNTLALATKDQVFCLSFQQPPSSSQRMALRKLLNVQFLTGFELPYTIILLAHTLGFDVLGYDLSTLKFGDIIPPGDFLHSKNVSTSARSVNEEWDGAILRNIDAKATGTLEPDYALRAWFTAIAAEKSIRDLPLSDRLSTQLIDRPKLQTYAELASRAMRRELMKPRIQDNDFSTVDTEKDGTLVVNNTRFKTRIRPSRQTHLELCMKNGDVVDATIKGAKGRRSSARTKQPLKGDVACIRVIGREERTNSEQVQYRFLRSALTGANASSTPLFVNRIWFPRADNTQGTSYEKNIHLSCDHESQTLEKLNHSQREIVSAMLSPAPQDSLVIAHGPPGTGKTTTIAAAAAIWVSRKLPCWIIAQSNVGVKNIAESLFRKEVDFRLIVSQEFYFEWHEKLYAEIQDKVIRSDDLPDSLYGISKTFSGIKVVLCTLSMLSNPKLADCGLFNILPVNSLVIDEASQIDVFEFMHLFYNHSKKLTKVCFFGDPKQLPPYGSGEAGLETIFDIKHLKKTAYFLDTQYRLPIHLGNFISDNVYNGKLRSRHSVTDRSCIAFIDVWKGEERKQGSSYKNIEEVHMVVRVARRYHQLKLAFCIITFYDPQRAAIIDALENEDLPSDCVYNVDSFQGNEKDYVILSSVRTKQPGFLRSQPRMNVALTRCRKGMVVVTDKSFLQGAGRNTLLGQLCGTWSRHHDACWIDSRAMLNNSGALPGLPAPAPTSTPARPIRNAMHGHDLGVRSTMPPAPARNPQSQTQTRRTHQDRDQANAFPGLSASANASRAVPTTTTLSAAEYIRRLGAQQQQQLNSAAAAARLFQVLSLSNNTINPNYHVGARSAAEDEEEFPSLRPLAAALPVPVDPVLSSSGRQRGGRGRR